MADEARGSAVNPKNILIAVLVIVAALLFWQYSRAQNLLKNPQEATRVEAERLKSEVAKLIEVPKDETPTVATVTDAEKLKSQPFFANAQTGDKVLIFPKAKKAVLYRPSTKKVIEVAPVNIGENQPQPAADTEE